MSWYLHGKKIPYVYADGGYTRYVILSSRDGEKYSTHKTSDGNVPNEQEEENALYDDDPIDPTTGEIVQWKDDETDDFSF